MNNSHFPKLMTTARAVLGELIMIWGERFDRGAKHPAARRGRLNQMIIERDIIYTPIDWPETLRADLYRPKDPERQAAVLLIHGGGWSTPDSRALMRPIAKRLAGRGYVVMNASYRLAPNTNTQHRLRICNVQSPGYATTVKSCRSTQTASPPTVTRLGAIWPPYWELSERHWIRR